MEHAETPIKTLRDEMAMAALIGMAEWVMRAAKAENHEVEEASEVAAGVAYAMADAMLSARNRAGDPE
jgi:hypothetical protein